MAGTLEATERLINEADSKFEDKLALAQKGGTTNLTAYADRTYNLRQHIAHNAGLTNDDHFMELLMHTEKYLSPEYQVRGEVDKKLTALLAGLLKSLLRETVALSSFAARKIQIEMIWQWYQDKQKQILDFSLKRMDEKLAQEKAQRIADGLELAEGMLPGDQLGEGSDVDGGEMGTNQTKAETGGQRAQMGERKRFGGYQPDQFGVAPLVPQQQSNPNQKPARPLTFLQEAARESESHNITKKLGLYRKRNLTKAEKLRQEIAARKAPGTAGGAPSEPRVVYTRDAKANRGQGDPQRPATHSGMRTGVSGPSPMLHKTTGNQERDAEVMRLDAAVVASQKHWVKRMIQKVEEENDRREMKDTLTTLAFNQARIEEESSRRLESEQYASQAGRTCHTILRREPRTKEGEEPVTTQSKQPSASLSKDETMQMLGMATFDKSDGTSTSLSPYDAYQPTALDEAKLQGLLSRVKMPETSASKMTSGKHSKIKSVHPRNMAGTPATNVKLDVATSADVSITQPVPRTDVPLIEQLFPCLREEEDVPSLARMEEMRLVERIRECLGRAKTKKGDGFHVPRKEIEMAILTPDDRPVEECLKLLPRPSSAYPKNPWAVETKKKGGKGKKKEKK